MPRSPLRGARKIFHDRDSGENEEKKAGFAFSWPILALFLLFLAGAIGWSFFMGFMVGQGHNPNTKIQEMTGISLPVPHPEENPQEEPAKTPPPSEEKIIQENPPQKPEAPFRVPRGQELKAWGEGQKAAAAPPKKEKAARTEKEELFDFSFQIAAFKNSSEAESFQKKLASAAIKAKIQKSGKVYLLIANIRGAADTPENLRKKLLPLKVGKPLQLSKKPVSQKTKRNR